MMVEDPSQSKDIFKIVNQWFCKMQTKGRACGVQSQTKNLMNHSFYRYVIEKKEKVGTRWVKSGKTSGPECKYRVTDVDEGTEVQFQVRAENEAGVGHPSEPTVIMTIEDAISMLIINYTACNK